MSLSEEELLGPVCIMAPSKSAIFRVIGTKIGVILLRPAFNYPKPLNTKHYISHYIPKLRSTCFEGARRHPPTPLANMVCLPSPPMPLNPRDGGRCWARMTSRRHLKNASRHRHGSLGVQLPITVAVSGF